MVFRKIFPNFHPNQVSDSTNLVDTFLSLENFIQAFSNVAAKQGGPGVDDETIDDFQQSLRPNISQLKDDVANNRYQPLPCKQILIAKNHGKFRELRVPTVRDRIVQHALLNVLNPVVEKQFSPVSFAYRPNLSYLDAVNEVIRWRDEGYRFVLDADITKFFDNINHQILLRAVRKYVEHPGILCLIKSWISVGVLTKERIVKADKGIPQGAVVSPLLANIYLDEFDKSFSDTDWKLVRYADDFLVLAKSLEEIVAASSHVEKTLDALELTLHPDKTLLTNFQEGFRFLGHGFIDNAIFPVESNTAKSPKSSSTEVESQLEEGSKKKSLEEQEAETTESEVLPTAFSSTTTIENVELKLAKKFTNRITWSREMATLYLLEAGTTIYKENKRFGIWIPDKNNDNNRVEIPIREIERILIFGNIQLTTPVIQTCLQEKIIVLFLASSGQYKGHVWNLESTHLDNELVQVKKHGNVEFQLPVCQAIVRGKLMNSRQLLLRLNRKRQVPEVAKAIAGINTDILAVDAVNNIESLRGYEGIGATRYFPAFGKLITNPDFSFSLRNRQPPQDPVNSLLSFGYTLLFNNVLSLIIAEGLSPYFGNFHYSEDRKNKPFLAFDLMEEFRSPIVDSFVLKLVNLSAVKPKDFESVITTGGVYLKSGARKVFLEQFEQRMNESISHPDVQSQVCYRQAIQLQIRRYKRYLLHGEAYEPFWRTT
ncbi:MAG: CRISPR-associated endonuclease Cas1 [Okeania sp. SIO3C4]|nr:CRISPR-associated endonuclease Cas1 [Okeania sp. SIO3C4]